MRIDEAELDNAKVARSRAATPACDRLDRSSGMIGAQQMKDCGNEHPAARQAATHPA